MRSSSTDMVKGTAKSNAKVECTCNCWDCGRELLISETCGCKDEGKGIQNEAEGKDEEEVWTASDDEWFNLYSGTVFKTAELKVYKGLKKKKDRIDKKSTQNEPEQVFIIISIINDNNDINDINDINCNIVYYNDDYPFDLYC